MNHLVPEIISLLCAALLCAACAGTPVSAPATGSAGRYDALKAEMTALAQKGTKANKIANLVITLIDDQDTVWEQGFGYANLEARVPVTIMIGGSPEAAWPLSPLGDGEAVIAGIGRYQGETIWVKTSGGEESLMFTGFEFRRRAS